MNSATTPDTWWARLRRFHRSAVFLTYGFTALRLAGFVLVMPVALKLMPSAEIGLWYVFLSIGGLCAIAELDFGPVIGRHASYYRVGATNVPPLGLPPKPGDAEPYVAGMAGLVRMAGNLYLKLSGLVLLLMLVGGGGWLLWKNGDLMGQPIPASAFLVYTLANVCGMAITYWPALLYGINRVHDYQKIFIAGLILNYALMLFGLLGGLGLLAMVLGQSAFLLYPRWRARRLFHRQIPVATVERPREIHWRQVWPMTWRGGCVTMGSFLCLSSTTLICSQVMGLEATASFTLSLKLALVGHSLGIAWLSVKFPEISGLRAQGRIHEVRVLVGQRMALALATYASVSAVAWAAAPPLLRLIGSRTPLLDPQNLALLMMVVGGDLVVGMHSAVLQTGNRVPHLNSMVLSGLVTVTTALLLSSSFGMTGLVLAPALAQLPLNYWWIPRRCWRELSQPVASGVAVPTA